VSIVLAALKAREIGELEERLEVLERQFGGPSGGGGMSALRGRIEPLAQMAGEQAEEAPVLIVERFGEDDLGGGWRGPWLGEDGQRPAIGVGGRPVTVQEVMFDGEGRAGHAG